MSRIFKYEMEIVANQKIEMPLGAHILDVQIQNGALCLWAEVHPEAPLTEHAFAVFCTGDVIEATNAHHLATVQELGGALVWHVFELI